MTARGKKIVFNSNGVSMPLEAYIKSGVTENHRGKSKKKKNEDKAYARSDNISY